MRAAELGIVCLLVSASAGPSHAQTCATEGEWSYEGTTGPSCWANLSREYEKCSGRDPPGGRSQLGPMQSPVVLKNTDGREHGYAPPPGTLYRPVMASVDLVISKVHHTVRLDFAAAGQSGNRIEMTFDPWSGSSYNCRDWADCNKEFYELQQLHFHAPSEHTFVEHQKSPLEVHLVHLDPNWPANWPAKIFVLGLLFEVGQNENPLLAKILANRQSISETPKTIPNVKVESAAGFALRQQLADRQLSRLADNSAMRGTNRMVDLHEAGDSDASTNRFDDGIVACERQRAAAAALGNPAIRPIHLQDREPSRFRSALDPAKSILRARGSGRGPIQAYGGSG